MKTVMYTISLLLAIAGISCQMGGESLSLSTIDANSNFSFEAKYPEHKSDLLEKYVDSVLKNEVPLNKDIDLILNLKGGDQFNLKAKRGWLKIEFDKKTGSMDAYLRVKKLSEGIGKRLSEK